MPKYEFQCPKCKSIHEVECSINDTPSTPICCINIITNRIFRPFGVIFKGTGFYSTDKGRE